MCFAPYVSLLTFVIELLLAMFFLLKNPKDKLNRIISLISLLLAVYQLNEFLICVTGAGVFVKSARIVTALLPALGISYTLIIFRKKIGLYWNMLMYAPAVFFILMFAFSSYLKQSAFCSTVFIQYSNLGLLGIFFGLYYLLYLSASVILFYINSYKNISRKERILSYLGMFGILIFTIPTFIFLLFLPALQIQFPSVLCEFALLLVIDFIFLLRYKDKYKIHY